MPKRANGDKISIMPKDKFYAYLTKKEQGIAESWPECQKIVSGVPEARYKGFLTLGEATRWLEAGAQYGAKNTATEDGVYFDAGTGAGRGVEVNVADKNGRVLFHKILQEGVTNNYGELLACKLAIEIAQKQNLKKVFGDSKLVLEFWSKGFAKEKELPIETIDLIKQVAVLRYDFEKTGGQILKIAGGSNPADLGYHKE